MRHRIKRKSCLLYPEDRNKVIWDFIVTLNLLVMCIYTPFSVAFTLLNSADSLTTSQIIHIIMDVIFGIDIVIVFFSAFYNSSFKIIDEMKLIAQDYLYGWFLIDIVAIIPFDFIFSSIDVSNL